MTLKMLKTIQIYKKHIFFGFSLFFAIFGFFSKILSNKWVKNWVATGGTCHPTAPSIFPKGYRSD
jgi:hypothetical protein